ncbi:hypothetical protein HETIRDRAFT_469948 [Heterobasidion irregulare TC 32-1]|uniref:DUF3752 domain-containing protein n=1 Tax=Heterobasidion irregulare (strain TC 32-1) TaxID=747525 RepID=W4KPI3_HETIT|nr:uncharacterized protein HETIRDRAFT_469948 [Heterobasidion irregulare TC 32-1]ETW87722.1 hypothetical protein HETIRDRAFT_469948 [Heterobasidion irregulare TC 32-1]
MASIGPYVPPSLSNSPAAPSTAPSVGLLQRYEEEEEEEEDDYAPALPPDLAAARINGGGPATVGPSRRIFGPSMGPQRQEEEESEDEEVGPAPLPSSATLDPQDGIREFREKEEQRRKHIEEAAKPKALQREEWMLVPPSSSDLLGTLDPTKLSKPRQFSRSTAPARKVDNSLWTETPAERQQRLADEVLGKKRRIENADATEGDEDEARKKRKRDAEIRREVEEHTRKHRGSSLLDAHADADSRKKKDDDGEGPPAIWDHSRDMSLGGRLMDEKDRQKMIRDARGLSDRFGTGRSGGFL